MRQTRRSAEVGRQEADLTASGPFLELARELQAEAQRWAADPDAGIESLVEVFDRLPREARQRAAEATFRSLPGEQRWAVLERLFGDDELRAALGHERDVAVLSARATTRRAALVQDVVARHVLDTRLIPAGEQLTLGLFRESDVRVALRSGPQSTTCARRLVLQATIDQGSLHVVADVFNPFNGLFVTPDYDERTWRAERVEPHAEVRIGATTGGRFETLVYPGGRLDVELAGAVRPGHLHVGWACVGDHNLFHPTNDPASIGGTQP